MHFSERNKLQGNHITSCHHKGYLLILTTEYLYRMLPYDFTFEILTKEIPIGVKTMISFTDRLFVFTENEMFEAEEKY